MHLTTRLYSMYKYLFMLAHYTLRDVYIYRYAFVMNFTIYWANLYTDPIEEGMYIDILEIEKPCYTIKSVLTAC